MSKPSNRTASETEHKKTLYRQLRKSAAFSELERWTKESAVERRRAASKSQDTAFGELRFADGMEYVLNHIKTMSS